MISGVMFFLDKPTLIFLFNLLIFPPSTLLTLADNLDYRTALAGTLLKRACFLGPKGSIIPRVAIIVTRHLAITICENTLNCRFCSRFFPHGVFIGSSGVMHILYLYTRCCVNHLSRWFILEHN